MNAPSLPPAIFLMGPTASGKSALAVELAQALEGEIISVDSALVFKGMDIGTAKPTLAERGGVPHHLIDILDPSDSFSTGEFRTQALAHMADITARQKLPILVGGTMLYFNALTQGLAQLPPADSAIRAHLEEQRMQEGNLAQHARLAKIDPKAAARIHPNDPQRVQRALEVYNITGRSLSDFFAESSPKNLLPYRVQKYIVAPADRAVLHNIIAKRFYVMLEKGFLDEVACLYERGDLHDKLPAIRAVGYREAWAYLQGDYDLPTMTEKSIIATRQLAKRQFTWLRRETDALYLETGRPHLADTLINAIKATQ